MTQLGTQTFSYSAENELALAGTTNRFYYDAMHRLVYSTAVTARYDRDGWDLVAIYNPAGAMSRRYVFGPDPDEPLVWYEGSGTTDRRWLHADERGSITAITNSGGGALNIDSYDEYGVPASTNTGRFQYTGQAWQSELGMYYYKSRMYVPSLGRFAQTDPIGYDGGPNLYAYVGNDPVNFTDPLGLIVCAAGSFMVEVPSETPATWGGGVGQANGPHVYCFRTQGTGGNSGPHVASGLSGGTATQEDGTPQNGSLLRRLYRKIVSDPCSGQGTNEGAGKPAGYAPYDVDEKGSLAALYGHVLPDHDFGSSASVLPMILSAIQTNPARGAGGSLVYTINTGQYVDFDARHEAGSDYITVVMSSPNANGTRTLITAYPGCR